MKKKNRNHRISRVTFYLLLTRSHQTGAEDSEAKIDLEVWLVYGWIGVC
ncbi:unnamed protein product [Rhodiola kirilowii]